jgi:thiol:disulfide interchange protein
MNTAHATARHPFRPFRVVAATIALGLLLAAGPALAQRGAQEPAGEAAASTPEILEWHLPGPEAAAQAAEEGKPILYFFTAEWCAPCHHLKRSVFSDPEKAAAIAASYVTVEVEDTRVETGANAPEVDEVQQRYGVRSLPTLVVALPDGQEVGNQSGYAGAARAWTWLQVQAKAAEAKIDDGQ